MGSLQKLPRKGTVGAQMGPEGHRAMEGMRIREAHKELVSLWPCEEMDQVLLGRVGLTPWSCTQSWLKLCLPSTNHVF